MRYVLIVLLLAGCASRDERRDALVTRAEQNCAKLGFTNDTPEMRDCKLRLFESATRTPAAIPVPMAQPPAAALPVPR